MKFVGGRHRHRRHSSLDCIDDRGVMSRQLHLGDDREQTHRKPPVKPPSGQRSHSIRRTVLRKFLHPFLRPVFQQSACRTFQIRILNSRKGHIMCGRMVGIQSATAENRRGKKEERKKKRQQQNVMATLFSGHNNWLNIVALF